ncbi:glycosyltransferase [Ferrovum myxofaciens]|uniref:glycosyltransferase n=1 Tax=Ferrovum myxofaciens TaxID=416213 RepID=UPI002357DBE1|nr:glycosyltransferase [Ferrovum myxofaciens]MBU6995348.1 glycosyltransferase [Ferrovum myxofaciens]
MKRILMVAYHFPPLAGSSGIQRTLRFMKYLPEFGWEPMVLTVHPRAYERTSPDLLPEVPEGTVVVRAPAFDTARHFSIAGRYPGFLARPDRWVSWLPGATLAGVSMIRRYRPDAIWSTYPIATAHLIGAALHKYSGLPWVADFRDPMAQDGYPADPHVWQSFKKIEESATREATLCTFTTPGTARLYSGRYPQAANRFKVIENGYDEETFAGLNSGGTALNHGKITLLHSGIVYPSERDPTQFLQAIRTLIDAGHVSADQLRVRFRASMHEDLLRALTNRFGLSECIELLPPISYKEALDEMLRADVLLVMQASNCNDQIPAKLYEYLRAGRPILALTDSVGDTASALRAVGISAIAQLDQADAIANALNRVIMEPFAGTLARPDTVAKCSRRNRTGELAVMLDQIKQ